MINYINNTLKKEELKFSGAGIHQLQRNKIKRELTQALSEMLGELNPVITKDGVILSIDINGYDLVVAIDPVIKTNYDIEGAKMEYDEARERAEKLEQERERKRKERELKKKA